MTKFQLGYAHGAFLGRSLAILIIALGLIAMVFLATPLFFVALMLELAFYPPLALFHLMLGIITWIALGVNPLSYTQKF